MLLFSQKNKWPKGIYANGHVLVDGEKMSKSKGNFLMLKQTVEDYSCDATRVALADAGDSLEDANFERKTADLSVLRLTTFITWSKEQIANLKLFRTGKFTFADEVFNNRINMFVTMAKQSYEKMIFRDALRVGWYDFQKAKEDYRIDVDTAGFHKDLIVKFIELQCLIMFPITPHVMEHIWLTVLNKKTSLNFETWPKDEPIDPIVIRTNDYFQDVVHLFRQKNFKRKKKVKESFKKCLYLLR